MPRLGRFAAGIATLIALCIGVAGCGDNTTVRNYKVGVLISSDPFQATLTGFQQGMVDLGYTDGKNITYQVEQVHGKADDMPAAFQRMLDAHVDLILTTNTASAITARKLVKTTPVVFVAVSDPIASGVVDDLTHPGSNLTGVNSTIAELDADRLLWLHKTAPTVKRVTLMYNPNDQAPQKSLLALRASAPNLGITLNEVAVSNAAAIKAAVADLTTAKTDAFFVMPDQLVFGNLPMILAQTTAAKLPMTALDIGTVKNGALMSYGPTFPDYGKQAAPIADKILHGMNPGDIAVNGPTHIALAINTTVAQKLGITIPNSVMAAVTDPIQ